jgi:hypothetical protein
VKIIRHLVMTENTLITSHLSGKRPNPNGRALLTDVNARICGGMQ